MNSSNNGQNNLQQRSSILTRSTTSRNHQNLRQTTNLINSSSVNTSSNNNNPAASIVDPNDEIWIEFLSSLHEPIKQSQPNEQTTSINLNNNNNLENNHENYSNNINLDNSRSNNNNNEFNYNSSNNQINICTNSSSSNYLNYDINNFIDNDDPDQDPDFTVCLDNYELDDPDYVDDWFQVPKKEAVALVKDAIEFCDTVPIVCELDQRNSKIKSTRKISSEITLLERNASTTNIEETSRRISKYASNISTSTTSVQTDVSSNQTKSSEVGSINNNMSPNNSRNKTNEKETQNEMNSSEINDKQEENQQEKVNNSNENKNQEFIPEFNEIQRRQLDEQLRNHVQLLTQTCLLSFCSVEYKHIFEDASNLLYALDNLNKPPDKDKNGEDEHLKGILSPNFEIINLKESIEIVDNIKKIESDKRSELDLKKNNGMPTKFLELIITSPVFYNTSLIPNCKYKYQSHFKRSQFSDSEKILLIMGFNKFKHLPKNECCQCIKQHLLPQRSCEDIKKQLSNISNSEQRQLKLKELLKTQKLNSKSSLNSKNFEFIKEVDYKSPLEQSDFIQLPSMYTLMIERLRMANILRDTKNHLKEMKEKSNNNNKNNSANINDESSFNSSSNSTQFKSLTSSSFSKADNNKNNDQIDTNQITSTKKRLRKSSSSSSTTSTSETSDISSNLSFLNRSSSRSPTKQISSTINATPKHSSMNRQIDLEFSTCSSSTTIERTSDEIEQIKTLRRTLITTNNEKHTSENNENQIINKSVVTSNAVNSLTPISTTGVTSSFTLPLSTNSSNNIFQLTANLNDRSIILPSLQPITLLKSIQQQPQQQQQQQQQQQNSQLNQHQTSPFLLPSNFSGTILYQPTIHIHTNSLPLKQNNNASTKKYRQIIPRK